jgi:oxygen-independent coproporphyrinogen-3 oxidase
MQIADWIAGARQGLAGFDLEGMKSSGILPSRGEDFFPVIGYPPLTMFGPMDQDPLFADFAQRPASPTIAYIHIPFCPSRCTFCHWITKTKSREQEVDDYLHFLDREMALYKSNMGLQKIPARSVLVGGGTPTYLNARQMERFLTSVGNHFDLGGCTQFSVEAEPTTLLGDDGLAKLQIMKDFGVHRISMGVQSFDDPVLAYMGRVHSRDDSLRAVEQMRRVGIDSIMIDLIYSYPNQTPAMWAENMLTGIALDVDGFQLYRLRVKKHGDRQGKILKVLGRQPEHFPDADETFLMKYLGGLIAEAHGYKQLQTRVYVKNESHMSHYLRDWCCDLTDVVGVGVSSWSNLRGVFSLNVGDTNLETYYDYIRDGKVAVNRGKMRSRDDELRRSFVLPLKNSVVDKRYFSERTGARVGEHFQCEIDWLKSFGLVDEDAQRVWLTARGRFFADEVSTQFFNPAFLPFPDVARPPLRSAC